MNEEKVVLQYPSSESSEIIIMISLYSESPMSSRQMGLKEALEARTTTGNAKDLWVPFELLAQLGEVKLHECTQFQIK